MMSTCEAAITAHVLWRLRISAILNSGDLTGLDREVVVQDDACDLGKWIYGPGAIFKDHKVFQDFQECHRGFHASIGTIIALIDIGDLAGARQEMNHGEFSSCSQALVASMLKLEKSAESNRSSQLDP